MQNAIPQNGASAVCSHKVQPSNALQFLVVLAAMTLSTIPIASIGIRFAMNVNPFWKPEQYSQSPHFRLLVIKAHIPYHISRNTVPIVGMLCGSTISSLVVSLSFVLQELKCVPSPVASHCHLVRLLTDVHL